MPQTRSIVLARQVGVPYIVVFEQGRHGRRSGFLELVEMEVRAFKRLDFPGDDIP